jgi:Lon protease-like protein
MTRSFVIQFEDLPQELSLFPLTGALLLPNGQLPLNIFEPRYLNMVLDALAGTRLIGMVQPLPGAEAEHPELHRTGCAGRIISFSETRDGRLLIVLGGVCRFDIVCDLDVQRGYRSAHVCWDRFVHDTVLEDIQLEKKLLLESVKAYLKHQKLSVEWKSLEVLDIHELVDTLACSLPFSPREKQGLLEAAVVEDRYHLVKALCEFGAGVSGDAGARAH